MSKVEFLKSLLITIVIISHGIAYDTGDYYKVIAIGVLNGSIYFLANLFNLHGLWAVIGLKMIILLDRDVQAGNPNIVRMHGLFIVGMVALFNLF